MDLYGPAIYGWARRCGLQSDDAAEIVQQVFLVLAVRFDRFRSEQPTDSFRAWLRTITLNKVRDFFRRRAGRAIPTGGSSWQRQIEAIPRRLVQPTNLWTEFSLMRWRPCGIR